MPAEIYDKYENQTSTEDQMPDELRQMLEVLKMEKQAKIEALGKTVAKRIKEAVAAKTQSGIEKVWQEDEEYYQGVDDANRSNNAWVKAAGLVGGISKVSPTSSAKCTAFFNVTAQFVDAASSRMGDILLPSGDWNFVIKPTPIPEKAGLSEQQGQQPISQELPSPGLEENATLQPPLREQPVASGLALPDTGVASPDGMTMQQAGGTLPTPTQQIDTATEKGEKRIKDWLVEGKYHAEVRKVIDDYCRLGTGILKGPVPSRSRTMVVSDGGKTVTYEEKISPISYRVDPKNAFPDAACGENIQDGNYFIERDELTAKKLRGMKGVDGYLSAQIDKVLEEGPGKKYFNDGIGAGDKKTNDEDLFEVWYFYGNVNLDDLSAMDVDCKSNRDDVPAVVTVVNDTPIKAFINPLDTGEFPYDVIAYQQLPGVPWGSGIARKGRVSQEMINASARALMDNAGLGAKPMFAVRQGAIRPINGDWTLTAGKGFIATEQSDTRSIADAITFFNTPMMQAELTADIQLGYKMMEDSTGMAYLMQGQQGSAPDTVGGMELLNRNASSVLRRNARNFDEKITEPHIRRYYAYLMEYGEDDEKGDMQIEAVGSSALVEREVAAQEVQQLLQASLNPAFGIDPAKAMAELLKAKRMSPDKFLYTEDQKAKMQQAPPQTVPAIEVAKIRVEADKELAQMRDELERYKTKVAAQTAVHAADVKTSLDAQYNNSLANRDRTAAELRMEELKLRREMAFLDRENKMLDYANKREISLDKVKGELAKSTMQLRVQKELAGVTERAVQVAETQMEPAGHAPNGEAFQK